MSKYQKVTGWWVYVIKTSNNLYYPGCSGEKYVCHRWRQNRYCGSSLELYIEQFGWENLEKIVLMDGLTKEQALQWEDKLICMYRQLGCCINKQRSGGIEKDKKEYNKWYIKEHKEILNEKKRQKSWTPEGKIYQKVANYNRYHTKIITPLEAKEMYLLTGYIPDFIK